MKKANVNGIELEYEVQGSGEPVLLISLGPIADSFLPLLAEKTLTDRFRLIAYRQRTLAESPGGQTPVSFAEHASDAAELLRALGASRAHVAGHSTGAAIALQLALDHANMVHSLILLEPPLFGVPSAGAFFEKLAPALAAYGSGDSEGAMALFMSVVCSLDWESCQRAIEKRIPGGAAWAAKNAGNFFENYLPALQLWQFGAEQASGITQPVLSVSGTRSEQLFLDSRDLLHAWFPKVEECRIEGVAHLLHLERPEPVVRGIAEFLASHSMSAGGAGRAGAEEAGLARGSEALVAPTAAPNR